MALKQKRVGNRFNAKSVFHDCFTKIFKSLVHCSPQKDRVLPARSGGMAAKKGVSNMPANAITGMDAALAHKIPMEDLFVLIESLPRKYRKTYCRYCFNGGKVSRDDTANFNKARALLIKKMKDYLFNS